MASPKDPSRGVILPSRCLCDLSLSLSLPLLPTERKRDSSGTRGDASRLTKSERDNNAPLVCKVFSTLKPNEDSAGFSNRLAAFGCRRANGKDAWHRKIFVRVESANLEEFARWRAVRCDFNLRISSLNSNRIYFNDACRWKRGICSRTASLADPPTKQSLDRRFELERGDRSSFPRWSKKSETLPFGQSVSNPSPSAFESAMSSRDDAARSSPSSRNASSA